MREVRPLLLNKAANLLLNLKTQDYGTSADTIENFKDIAKISSVLTNKFLDPLDICWVLIALKLVREKRKAKEDNLIDAMNYLEIRDWILTELKQENENLNKF